MKYFIVVLSVLAFIFISCDNSKKGNSLLPKPGDIKADEYVISIDKDTTLVTKNGALLKIPKGSLTTDRGNTVTLEIKEAYSVQQMIQFGLTTQSNGNPLSSGGMIYINAAGGQKVTINQGIKVAIPADYLNANMELFKGEQTEDGSVNWDNPTALPENGQVKQIEQGRALFQNTCTPCHNIGKEATGPDLANILKRPFIDKEDGYPQFHSGVEESRYSEDPTTDTGYYHYGSTGIYHCNVRRMFGSAPPLFLELRRDDILGLYTYIQNESNRKNLPLPSHAYLDDCIDSCRLYKEKVGALQNQKQIAKEKKKGLIKNNGPLVDTKTEITPPSKNDFQTATPLAPVDFEEKVSPENYDAVYYQFTIENFGWFNIDMLLKNINGVEESELFVRIVGEYREKIKVFLIIPSEKVYGEGGPAERSPGEFAFFYKSGKLPLPQNVKAYIMAVTETESSIAFSLQEFTTGRQQQLDISLKASTKQEFEAAIQRISLDELKIKVADAKNGGEIRQTDADIKSIDEEIKKAENLKPKRCDCDCGQQPADSIGTVMLEK